MTLYEGMFLMDNRQANRDWDGSLEKLKGLLTKHGCELVRCDKWGERKLAYEIAGRRRGTYVLTYFNASGDAVSRVYRECELADLILRVLILKAKAVPSDEEIAALAEGASRRRPFRGRERPPAEKPKAATEAATEAVTEAATAAGKDESAPEDAKPDKPAGADAKTEAAPEADAHEPEEGKAETPEPDAASEEKPES